MEEDVTDYVLVDRKGNLPLNDQNITRGVVSVQLEESILSHEDQHIQKEFEDYIRVLQQREERLQKQKEEILENQLNLVASLDDTIEEEYGKGHDEFIDFIRRTDIEILPETIVMLSPDGTHVVEYDTKVLQFWQPPEKRRGQDTLIDLRTGKSIESPYYQR